MSDREVLLVVHTGRAAARERASEVVAQLAAAGVLVRVLAEEADALAARDLHAVPTDERAAAGVELVLVFGGDGTLLRAAELARPAGAPLLGVNLGHIGFLAEAEQSGLAETVDRILDRRYRVRDRMTVDVSVTSDGSVQSNWAVNDISVEKVSREHMIELVVEVDGRPLSRWGCDGVICATPTGSTAYAFSVGGPVVWPDLSALLVLPISAHALFNRPLVVSPESVVAIELVPETSAAVLFCDGRRSVELPAGARIEVRRGHAPLRLVRLWDEPFADRLVAKFDLPVQGWRGR
jgi:NAD+ kinase